MTAAVTVRAVGTPVHFALNVSRTLVIPAGTLAQDFLVMLITGNTGAIFTKTGMTGWTEVPGGQVINTTFGNAVAYYKWANVGDAGASVLAGNYAANQKGVGVIIALDGTKVDPINPITVAMVGAISNTLGTAHAIPTATASGHNATPLLVVSDRASATIQTTSTWTYPAGYTNVVTNQGSTDVNSGEEGIGVAIGGEILDTASSPSGNATGNNLSHFTSAVLLINEFVPPDVAEIQIMDDSGWHTVEVVGVGESGLIHAVTMVDRLSGLHTPDSNADFSGGSMPALFSFNQGVVIESAAADPLGSSGYGAHLTPQTSSPFAATLTKSAATAPTNKPWASIKVRCKLITLPGAANTYDNLFEIGNSDATAPKNQFTMYWNNRALWADFGTGDAVNLSLAADTTDWHTYEARVFFGATTYTAKVRIDGGTPIDMTSANDKEVATSEEIWIGYPSALADYERYIGRVAYSVGDTDPGWLT